MAGAKFEYDDKGTTFYYFLISFYGLILVPLTYYVWNYTRITDDKKKNDRACHCPPCLEKRHRLNKIKPKSKSLRYASLLALVILWGLFCYGGYRISQFEKEYIEYDPFNVLEIDRGATTAEIRRQYRRLSMKFHPDKETGDSKIFMRIAKAYEALTNEESKKNWEEFGNPDGPGVTSFGIALPSWLVSKENSMWVLAAYGLAFMIILPTAVGTWWYKSIQYSCDQILLDTTQLYYYFFHKTPGMHLKRILMILAGSLEFEKGHNGEVTERVTDNEEIPQLMRELPNLGDKNKEPPLCYAYSIKARSLIHAHLSRLELPPNTLMVDLHLILQKSPMLVQEMISCVSQLIAMAKAGRTSNMPRLETVENCMRLSQMLIQGSWDNKSPLLQLPNINLDNLRHFTTKKRNIRSIRQLVSMKEDDRRLLLRNQSDEEYNDIVNVIWSFPVVEMTIRAHVLDDTEDKSLITVGDIVTVSVHLKRHTLGDFFEQESNEPQNAEFEQADGKPEPKDSPQAQKVWHKNKKKGKKTKQNKQPVKKKTVKQPIKKKSSVEEKEDTPKSKNEEENKKQKEEIEDEEHNDVEDEVMGVEDEKIDSGSESGDEQTSGEESGDESNQESVKTPEEEEEEWQRLQADVKNKEAILETKSKDTHTVHAPYFPEEKQEWWWMYVTDRKRTALVTPPHQVTSLIDEEEVELKFQAPDKTGTYNFTVNLRSDCYLDCDVQQNFKITVEEAKEFETKQWDFDSDEEDKDADEESGESEYEEDDEYSD